MRDPYKTERNPKEPVTPPSSCPACRSSDIMTTSKVVTVESYWRCGACGEVWNVTRRETDRPSPGHYRRY
jgi:transposase-like protein